MKIMNSNMTTDTSALRNFFSKGESPSNTKLSTESVSKKDEKSLNGLTKLILFSIVPALVGSIFFSVKYFLY